MAKSKAQIISLLTDETIISKIYMIRGQKVMFDRDLAEMYGVETKRLNEQVKRNLDRFPTDFMFQVATNEFNNLKSQFATSSSDNDRFYIKSCVFKSNHKINGKIKSPNNFNAYR